MAEELLDAVVVAIGIEFERPGADIVRLRAAAELRRRVVRLPVPLSAGL